MKRAFVLAALLMLTACGDKDKLPDDLTQAEGTATAEEVNLETEAEPEAPPPAPPGDATMVENSTDEPAEQADPLAPKPPASDPSFDCTAASGRVERHICDVPELGRLDRRVAEAFDRAMDEASTEQADRLRNLGRRYIGDRNRCRDDYCIRQAYRWYERDIYGVMGWPGPQ